VSPDDTLPCPASVGDTEARKDRAKVAYAAYSKSLSSKGFTEETWEELEEFEREGWLEAADAAYNHVVVSPNAEPLPPSSPPTSRRP